MHVTLIHTAQDFQRNQQISAGEQEKTITYLSNRVPLYAHTPMGIDLAGG